MTLVYHTSTHLPAAFFTFCQNAFCLQSRLASSLFFRSSLILSSSHRLPCDPLKRRREFLGISASCLFSSTIDGNHSIVLGFLPAFSRIGRINRFVSGPTK